MDTRGDKRLPKLYSLPPEGKPHGVLLEMRFFGFLNRTLFLEEFEKNFREKRFEVVNEWRLFLRRDYLTN